MPALIEAIEIKRKSYFEYENAPYHCLDVEVSKPTARGGQTLVRLKMRNLLTRAVFDRTFKAGEKFSEPDLVKIKANYLYADNTGYNFMDQENYETVSLAADTLGDDRQGPPPARWPDVHVHGACSPRRHQQRQRDQDSDARDGAGGAGSAIREGRR